jgi:hypothetical protein
MLAWASAGTRFWTYWGSARGRRDIDARLTCSRPAKFARRKFYTPDEFNELRDQAYSFISGTSHRRRRPFSYHAHEQPLNVERWNVQRSNVLQYEVTAMSRTVS